MNKYGVGAKVMNDSESRKNPAFDINGKNTEALLLKKQIEEEQEQGKANVDN